TEVLSQVSVLDSSFKIGSGADGPVDAVVVLQDQRILLGGEFTAVSGASNAYLARLSADGTLDPAFNPRGQTDGEVFCMAQQPDGKVLVGGQFNHLLGMERHGLARLLEDGTLDPSLNPNAAFPIGTTVFSLGL